MKVGLLIYGQLDGSSGGYLYDRTLVEDLERNGHLVEVVGLKLKAPGWNTLDNLDPRLLRRLQDLDVDVLVEDELNHPSLFLLNRRLRMEAPYPLVALVHHLACRAESSPGRAARHRAAERRFLQSMDGFIFNSMSTMRTVQELVPGAAGVVAHPGKDHIKASAELKAPASGTLKVLFLGNILPHKGLHVLLRALSLFPRESVRLEAVGAAPDPAYMDLIHRMLDQGRMLNDVRFHGRLPDVERDRVLESCHVLAMPSYHEGYGLAFVEALAKGLPVIAPSSGGAGEIITHGQQGFLLDQGDHLALAHHLAELDRDRGLLHSMSRAARERYDQLPTWGAEMRKARTYLVDLVGHRPDHQGDPRSTTGHVGR